MLALKVKGSIKAVTSDLTKVQKQIVPTAAASALNKSAAKVRTVGVRETAQRVGVKQRFVRARTRIRNATRKRLSAWLFVILAGIPAIVLAGGLPGIRQTRAGVRVGRHEFPGAFPALLPGRVGVFKRRGRKRLPIVEQKVQIDPPANEIFTRHMNATGGREFKRLFEHELKWRLERKGLA